MPSKLDSKYIISGPAPLGRILNYIKRIKLGSFETIIRGEIEDPKNLDDWTVCLMVGLGLTTIPIRSSGQKTSIQLTSDGETIYKLIKDSPDYVDPFKQDHRQNMLDIKKNLLDDNVDLYNLLKVIFMKSAVVNNLILFFKQGTKEEQAMERVTFYKKYGKKFKITKAGFNRLPSVLNIAEFCDMLIEDGRKIKIYDENFIVEAINDNENKAMKNIVKQDLKNNGILKIDDDFLVDVSKTIKPEKIKTLVTKYKRYDKLATDLKKIYNSECQICGFTFKKKNGKNYAEAHHIIALGVDGDDDAENLVVVCANCHRQLHYDSPEISPINGNDRKIILNGKEYNMKYKEKHLKAFKK